MEHWGQAPHDRWLKRKLLGYFDLQLEYSPFVYSSAKDVATPEGDIALDGAKTRFFLLQHFCFN
jgi:hypothetical protein